MINVQSLRQTGQPNDVRHPFHSNIFCRNDDHLQSTNSFCISDRFDEHGTTTHLQRQNSSTIIGTTNGFFVRQILETKFHPKTNHFASQTDWLMIFLASKTRLYCRRLKMFEQTRYPSIEQLVIVLNCLCSNPIDFYFDEPQANQFMCDYLDALSVKGEKIDRQFSHHFFLFFFCFVCFCSNFSGRFSSVDGLEVFSCARTSFKNFSIASPN